MYPYELDLKVRIESNSSEKVILCSADFAVTYKHSGISLEYDAIFVKRYPVKIGEQYECISILHTKLTSIHYQTLLKKDTPAAGQQARDIYSELKKYFL